MKLVASALVTVAVTFMGGAALGQQPVSSQQPEIKVEWQHKLRVSRSTPTLQVVVNPMLSPGAPLHDGAFDALKKLGANYVRYVPWLPYPKMAVAELKPPTADHTYWDFSHIDPITTDFLEATRGHSTVMNFSTIPEWMFKTAKPVEYPANPDQVAWHYEQGTELRDPSCKELGEYYARLVSWYTKGGFRDEHGKWHHSGYHYQFPYWEVLNEVDFEHDTTPQLYTREYDAIVSAIHRVSPKTKFMGLALANPSGGARYFEYFLNHKNHRPGIPIDYISFHFYATHLQGEGPKEWPHTMMDEASRFLDTTQYILALRNVLSPKTKIDTDELGVILPPGGVGPNAGDAAHPAIPKIYWNAAASLYGYLFVQLSRMGVDVIGESQLVGYPSQYPSVSMIDYTNGKPNARYWVLKMLVDNFHPGDVMELTDQPAVGHGHPVLAQGYDTPQGRKILVVNMSDESHVVEAPVSFVDARFETVDEATGDDAPRTGTLDGRELTLAPFAVTVLRAAK
ncbi:MAG: GH39 family glycosyl hydrolase [Acidobacteriaceae bacterium]